MSQTDQETLAQRISKSIYTPDNQLQLNNAISKLKRLLIQKKQYLQQTHPVQVINKLWIGNYAYSSNCQFLRTAQIQLIISCMDKQPIESFPNISYEIIPLKDSIETKIEQHFQYVYTIIESALTNHKSVYIHCFSGKSRSAALLTSYLIKKYHFSYDQAIQFLKNRYPLASPNSGFINKLKTYQNQIKQLEQLKRQQETNIILENTIEINKQSIINRSQEIKNNGENQQGQFNQNQTNNKIQQKNKELQLIQKNYDGKIESEDQKLTKIQESNGSEFVDQKIKQIEFEEIAEVINIDIQNQNKKISQQQNIEIISQEINQITSKENQNIDKQYVNHIGQDNQHKNYQPTENNQKKQIKHTQQQIGQSQQIQNNQLSEIKEQETVKQQTKGKKNKKNKKRNR